MPAEQVLQLCSALPLKKAQDALAEHDKDAVLPEELVKLGGSSVLLRLKTVKKSLNHNS
jgi:hypothetical protein